MREKAPPNDDGNLPGDQSTVIDATPHPDPPPIQAGPAVEHTMICKLYQSIMLLVHGRHAPTDAEWDSYLAQVGSRSSEIKGILVLTDGGGPTGSQRSALKHAMGRAGLMEMRTAVVSSDRLTRGIVIALTLFAPNLRAFKPDAIDDALAHVQVHGPARQAIIAELEWLRQQIAH